MGACKPTSRYLVCITFLSKFYISFYQTRITLHHKIQSSYKIYIQDLKPWSHFRYTYLLPVISFWSKNKQCPYPGHHKQIWPTQAFPRVRIWQEPHINSFNSTYIQPSTFKNTPTDSNTHAHGLTHTYIYTWKIQKHSETDFKFMFLFFQHQLLNVWTSKKTNPNPHPSCWIYVQQQNLSLTLIKKPQ